MRRYKEFENKKAIILNDHPHKGENATCLGADKTTLGWAIKFKSDETGIEFYVWNETNVRWL